MASPRNTRRATSSHPRPLGTRHALLPHRLGAFSAWTLTPLPLCVLRAPRAPACAPARLPPFTQLKPSRALPPPRLAFPQFKQVKEALQEKEGIDVTQM